MIRAFVGVRVSPDVARKIAEVQSHLKHSLEGIRWVDQENFHFTLKFLGAVKEEDVAPILSALEQGLQASPSFPILSRGIGVFPDIRRPRVLWVGLEGAKLAALALAVEQGLERFGFDREKRGFKPHLTLGRWRNFAGSAELLKQELMRYKDYHFGESQVKEVVFFRSVVKSEGAVYSPLGVVTLSQSSSNQGGIPWM